MTTVPAKSKTVVEKKWRVKRFLRKKRKKKEERKSNKHSLWRKEREILDFTQSHHAFFAKNPFSKKFLKIVERSETHTQRGSSNGKTKKGIQTEKDRYEYNQQYQYESIRTRGKYFLF